MGDLRKALERLVEAVDALHRCARKNDRDVMWKRLHEANAAARSLLASHPAPSPSVSRDAETCRERSNVGHGCRREAGHEGRHRDRHGNEWAAPSPRSEAGARSPMGRDGWTAEDDAAEDAWSRKSIPPGGCTVCKGTGSRPLRSDAGTICGSIFCGPCNGSGRAPVPAESATRCTSDGTDLGRRTCDCPEHAATKGEEDGR